MPGTATAFYAPLDTWFEARSFPCEGGITVLVRGVIEARAMSARLSEQAAHDAFTGLIDRRELLTPFTILSLDGGARSSKSLNNERRQMSGDAAALSPLSS
ncbi:hypothetical protein [Paraburkholderia sp. CNPSo 3281]|uniref:hypothetical protein n=1 Tax=Paraburkholderia sp. CNPSo 3281 TaxID=2940933 RepID=UPI0020B6FB00|nr:hypothetical protein [Paraburkholderia sp. CNPSo 3281]MCP3720535.1 hypothetical protein [Paraburkholderia sp. CNPSo 3281]